MILDKLALVGVCALIVASTSQAQTPTGSRGATPPGSSFGSNPFAGKPGGADDGEDAFDDEEIDDISDEILRQRMEQRLKERGGNPSVNAPGGGGASPSRPTSRPPVSDDSVDFGEASNAIGATSMVGGANSKISKGEKNKGCLTLDPYTGYGPDVVTNFDFPDADVVEIAKTLGRLTCLNFILDKDVKGKISVVSNSQITVGDAWKAFLTALDVNGFSIVPSGKYLRIARQRDAKDKQIKTYSGEFSPDNDLYITRVLPLKYISAEEVARVFRNFMPPNTRIISYDQTNTLIITDTGSNIKKIVDMVQLLDVEGYDEGLEVIRIKFASAQDIAKLIDQLLPGSGGSPAGGPPGGIPRFRGGGFTARKTKEGGVISHIIPDDRTNSVIVSANAKGLEQVKELINKLDAKNVASVGGSRIHVVYLQYADAEQVSTTLNNLAAAGGPKAAPAPGAAPTTANLFEGAIKISADKATNSLVITGTPSDFATINRVIQKLDVARDQVYVEAIIMEMTLDKKMELGTSIAAPSSGIGFAPNNDLANFLQNPFSVAGGLVLGFKGGKSQSYQIADGKSITVSTVQGLIKAIQANTNTNVLATPQILTLDNQEASIEIGSNIPYTTQTQVQGAGVSTGVTYQKVALKLKIKPQINKASNFVKLDIDQSLDDIAPSAQAVNGAPATITRGSKTTVVVQDSDTVAMGGLVRNNVSEQTTKIPLLGDIPLLGWLFRSKTTTSQKQNLLVFITPKIIKQYQNIRRIVDKKIRQRDEFLEKNNGGEDPFQDDKLEIIKNLPPVSELRSSGRVENAEVETGEDTDSDSKNTNSSDSPARLAPPSGQYESPSPLAPSVPKVDSNPASSVLTSSSESVLDRTAKTSQGSNANTKKQ